MLFAPYIPIPNRYSKFKPVDKFAVIFRKVGSNNRNTLEQKARSQVGFESLQHDNRWCSVKITGAIKDTFNIRSERGHFTEDLKRLLSRGKLLL